MSGYLSRFFKMKTRSCNRSLVISFLVTAVRNREERKREYVPVQESRNVFRNGGVDERSQVVEILRARLVWLHPRTITSTNTDDISFSILLLSKTSQSHQQGSGRTTAFEASQSSICTPGGSFTAARKSLSEVLPERGGERER